MGKIALLTPVYISVVWSLMISYQLFTETAMNTTLSYISYFNPSINFWLNSKLEIIVFIYAFAWVFVFSSVLPGLILGKNRSVLIQFFTCLAITLLSFIIQDGLFSLINSETIRGIMDLEVFLENPYLATMYLSLPYVIMLAIDIQSRRSNRLKVVSEQSSLLVEDSNQDSSENYQKEIVVS